MKVLNAFRKNIYSQNGEDGVIKEIFNRLNIKSGWFCEFGAWDGKYGSNCYSLLFSGWKGLMIEGDSDRFGVLVKTASKHKDNLLIQNTFVQHQGCINTLDDCLSKTEIPDNFDLLSIDIDSYDYHVWDSLEKYRPKVVIIEIDSSVPPGSYFIYDGSGRLTSFDAMIELASSKKYTLICHTGNLFFVTDELFYKLNLNSTVNPADLFVNEWINPNFFKVSFRKLKNLTFQRLICKVQNFIH